MYTLLCHATILLLYYANSISSTTAILLCFFLVLVSSGVFDPIPPPHLTVCPSFSAVTVYREGSFSQLPAAFSEVAKHCVNKQQGIGIFLDNPDVVAKPAWVAGFVVPSRDARTYAEAAHAAGVRGVQLYTVPQSTAYQTVVPWRHPFTPMLHARTVYQNLEEVVGQLTAPAIEFYDTDSSDNIVTMRTVYLTENQEEIMSCFDYGSLDPAPRAGTRR
uniref:Uncharacterized protein n=1 Tax=Sexangularia sp. CB-2014 TaxID=1486929 RepID=A0A7S1VA49_9EUKA